MKIVADSYAWLEIATDTRSGRLAASILSQAERVFVPDVVLAEVARKYLREGTAESTVERRLAIISESAEVVPIDNRIALDAAEAYVELRGKAKKSGLGDPSLFDAIVLSTARNLGAKLLSGDQHFRGLPETMWPVA